MKYCLPLFLLLVSCGAPAPDAKKTAATPAFFVVDPSTAATVAGRITFTGKAPAAKRIAMDAEEECEKLHPQPVLEQPVRLDQQGHLADALVYIKTGLEGKVFAPSPEVVRIDQRGCQFLPRIVAVRAGQTFAVKNSDPVTHSIHPMPKANRDWNQTQAPGAPDLERRFVRGEIAIPVKCNVHAWMHGNIAVLDHPYYALTDASGAYTLPPLPPGDYTLAVWHETLGEITRPLHLEPKAKAVAELQFPR